MAKKLYIKTFGCQMNEYDSSRMADLLAASHGYDRVEDAESADMVLLNTCSVREKAQEKVFSQLGRWRQIKDRNPAPKALRVVSAPAGNSTPHFFRSADRQPAVL